MDKVSKIGLTVTVLLLIGWFYWTSQQKKTLPPAAPGADQNGIGCALCAASISRS